MLSLDEMPAANVTVSIAKKALSNDKLKKIASVETLPFGFRHTTTDELQPK